MQNNNNDFFNALKKIIRTKKLTYREIAKNINMSESGLKKLMASEDCSLSKLGEICHAVGVSIEEVYELLKNSPRTPVTFSKKQEEAFIKNPSLYNYFLILISCHYDEKALREIKNLSVSTSQKYLYMLDKLNLITLETKNRIKPVIPEGNAVQISGKLATIVKYNIDDAFVKYMQKKTVSDKDSVYFGGRGTFVLCENSLKELKQEIETLYEEYFRRTKREIILYKEKDLTKSTMLTLFAKGFETTEHMGIDKI